MKNVFPPFFVISLNEEAQETCVLGNEMYRTQKEAEAAANTGVGVVNYVVATIAEYDRTSLDPKDIADECAKLMLEITQHRHTSSPQCIPVAMYRKMEKLANQYKIASEKTEKQS